MRGPITNISASVVQQVINQFFGLVIFYVLSRNMDKSGFGELNWSLAFLLTAFSVLSFGLDQLAIKKIASGEKTSRVVRVVSLHVLVAGLIFYGGLVLFYLLNPHTHILLLLLAIGAGKLMIFFSLPFKQAAAGTERFALYAAMSVVSNVVRGLALVICGALHMLDLRAVIIIFIAGDTAEFIATLFFYRLRIKLPVRLSLSWKAYAATIKEALPQIGVVLSTAVMARFDWLFIGFFISAASLAEYSFAYKAYELSTLPLLVIAPLLIPRFVKYFKKSDDLSMIYPVLRIQMIACSLIIIVVNILWAPAIDAITNGKYGAVNSRIVFLLMLCTPFLYVNNILWTIAFAKGKLKGIFKIISVTCCVNIAADIFLIPLMHNNGAALACLLSLIVQMILYCRLEKNISFVPIVYAVMAYPLFAFIAIGSASFFSENIVMSLLMGSAVFLTLVLLVNKFIRQDIRSGIELLSPDL